jgi:hypothetical protein
MDSNQVNWGIAFNRLFTAINKENTPTYCSGPGFLKMVKEVDPDCLSYSQLLVDRKNRGLSQSRKDYFLDLIKALTEPQRFRLFRLFIDGLETSDKDSAESVKEVVFGGGRAVPVTVVPFDLWNSEKLNNNLNSIDHAIATKEFNRATTLSYTCLEGLYKAYVRKHVPDQAGLTDLLPLCRVVKDDISKKLSAQGPFPVEIVNAIPTLTNAIANSRNGFSESHFGDDSQRWLALFARDLVNSIGRLLLNFI